MVQPDLNQEQTRRPLRWLALVWLVVGFACPLFAGELYLRTFPPKDLWPYLGEASPEVGMYKADPITGVDFRERALFIQHDAARIQQLKLNSATDDQRPRWLLFGNSFIQMDGMLGDHLQRALPNKQMVFLKRNEFVYIRVAQLRHLMEMTPKVERIIFALMPLDSVSIGQHPLSTVRTNQRGAITYDTPELTQRSRLMLAGWLRLLKPIPQANSYAHQLNKRIPEELEQQYNQLFAEMKRIAGAKPVTLLLIPTYEQIMGRGSHLFQDRLTALAVANQLDVFDARHVFNAEADQSSLFIPDKHFSDRGNRILLRAVLTHLGEPSQ